MKLIALGVAAVCLALATAAAAGTPVNLRSDPASGPAITLGDLFDGAGPAARVMVGTGAPAGLNAVLDAGQVQQIAHINGLDWTNPKGIRRIIVHGGAVAAETATTALAAPGAPGAPGALPTKTVEVLTYARSLATGEVVQPADLTYAKLPSFQAPQDAPRDAAEIIGKAARRPLRSGTAVAALDVTAAQVIKRDDMIDVAFHAEGMTLTLQGKALGAAAIGETLNVMNLTSKKVIQAVAVGPDQAVVGPEAEHIKSTGLPAGLQYVANR
jgi:flagellar basal body P-ring formation protein FlgA